MLKLFLLIPLITLEVVATLSLIYFTVFVDPGAGFLVTFLGVLTLLTFLAFIDFYENQLEEE